MRTPSSLSITFILSLVAMSACEEQVEDPLFAGMTDTGEGESGESDTHGVESEPDPGAATELPLDDPDTQQTVAIPLPVLNSLTLWLRADAGVNVNQNGVYRWDDQSPSSNNATQASGTALPEILYQALNSYPVLRFDGDDFFVLNSTLQLSQHTIFVVAKSNKVGEGFHMILGAGGNTANTQMRFENSSSVLFAGLGNGMPTFTSPTGNNKVFHSMSVNYNGNAWKVRRDGVLKSTNNFQVQGTWDLRDIGAWFSKYHLVGDLAEIIVYNRSLSDAEISSVQGYLNSKYGLGCVPSVCQLSDCGYVSNGCGGTNFCGLCKIGLCGDGICKPGELDTCPQDCW